jgi:hypothetical protein
MTVEQFNIFMASRYPGLFPVPGFIKSSGADRWFRIHSLPLSKRYADDEEEWSILLDRQNQIITEIFGDKPTFLLLTGDNYTEGYIELHPLKEAESVAEFPFTILEPLELHTVSMEFEEGQIFTPMFIELVWHPKKFDKILMDIADEKLQACFISRDEDIIIAPYDGGVDFVLQDTKTRDYYMQKYSAWLSPREDGL